MYFVGADRSPLPAETLCAFFRGKAPIARDEENLSKFLSALNQANRADAPNPTFLDSDYPAGICIRSSEAVADENSRSIPQKLRRSSAHSVSALDQPFRGFPGKHCDRVMIYRRFGSTLSI